MAKINNAIEPLTFGLTSGTWVKVLEQRPRASIYLENENSTNLRYQFPINNNPFAYDFITNTDIAITSILTAPNTWADATEGTIIVRFKADAHAGIRYLVSFGDTNADEHLSLWVDDNEKIAGTCVDGGTVQWTFTTDNAIQTDVWYEVKLAIKRYDYDPQTQAAITPRLFIDGEAVPITFSVTTDKTKFMSALAGVDNGYVGCSSFNSAGKAGYFEGEIDYVKIFDNSRTSAIDGSSQVLFIKLDEGTGTTATDSFTHGDNGTITAGGGAWVARNDGTLLRSDTARFMSLRDGDHYIKRALWAYTAAGSQNLEVLEADTDGRL